MASREEGVTLADSVDILGVDLRTRVKKLGANGKARRKKCRVRFSLIKKNKVFQKSCKNVGVKKLLRAGYDDSKDLGMAAAAGQKSTTSLSLLMEAHGLRVEEELFTLATHYWAEGVWSGKWHHEQREAWMRQIQEAQMWG